MLLAEICASVILADINQRSETNLMHVLCNLLRIKGLYMFPALLAQPLEALYKQHLVCCLRVLSVGLEWICVPLQSW
jgi:hypothetical protein